MTQIASRATLQMAIATTSTADQASSFLKILIAVFRKEDGI